VNLWILIYNYLKKIFNIKCTFLYCLFNITFQLYFAYLFLNKYYYLLHRETWGARSRGRGDYRGPMRDRYSPGAQRDLSPPVKRMRPPDWLVFTLTGVRV